MMNDEMMNAEQIKSSFIVPSSALEGKCLGHIKRKQAWRLTLKR
jgi:hypothetical protein